MGKPVDPPGPDDAERVDLKAALEERYLAYALSTIMHRALPDARDGLKPVHRRIMHAMRLLKLDPGQAHKKCARIVGDVIGKYHPHGDQAVYDALVRLAQDFSQRYPLIDGQGNFGNVDGDNAAAYRYTALYLIQHPASTSAQLMTFVQGPDFPTGGIIVESRAAMVETYTTGRGAFRTRARWHKEETNRGGWVIVVTEVPYLVTKGRMIEKIAELLQDKKLPLVADMRDESAEDIRIVFEPRARTVDPVLMMESLFRLTELESRFSLNMNVLMGGTTPRVVGLAEVLRAWLDHRREVLLRRSRHRLGQIDKRLEILRGLLIVYLDLDKVIQIIREEDEPKAELMRYFQLSEVQANAILDTRLRALRKLEEMELKRELEQLEGEKSQIEALLASDDKQWKTISWEIRAVRKAFGPETPLGKRRTTFAQAPDTSDLDLAEAMVDREPITVVITKKGWVRALKGHVQDLSSLAFKGDDGLHVSFFTETTAKVLVLASNGKIFTLDAAKLPGGRGFGDPIRLMIDLEESAEIVSAWAHKPGLKLLMVGSNARGFIVPSDDVVANTRKGRNVLNVEAPDTAVLALPVAGDHVAIIGENRKLLCFPLAEVPEMSRGKGVRLQKYKDGNVADARVFALADGLTWQSSDGRTYKVARPELDEWLGHRAEAGRLPPKGFPKSNRFGG